MVGKSPQLSEFLTSGDLPVGDKLEIVKNPGESHKHNPRLMGYAINIIHI
ncbi:hypothetical protein HJC23_005691 [Cyclotella cryptica]|uniref:Uncharacterized protein n=1 Tax=Cyclotella cryptica TaxID=29204 RepID=A0ABD3PDJ7_9STRA